MMTINPGPYDIRDTACVIGPGGLATPKPMGPALYEELDAEFDRFRDHLLVQRYTFSEAWPTWEQHPEGEEMVYLLDGDTDLVLWRNNAEERIRLSSPGQYILVPRGIWHTARPRRETSMLFVTPGEGTMHREKPSA